MDSPDDPDLFVSRTVKRPTRELEDNRDHKFHCVDVDTTCTWNQQSFGPEELIIHHTDKFAGAGTYYLSVFGAFDSCFDVHITVS